MTEEISDLFNLFLSRLSSLQTIIREKTERKREREREREREGGGKERERDWRFDKRKKLGLFALLFHRKPKVYTDDTCKNAMYQFERENFTES